MSSNLLAALDLGSNTFRMVLAEMGEEGPSVESKRVFQELPRLSEGLTPGGSFGPEPMERAFAALQKFYDIARTVRPAKVAVGGTMAFRLAANSALFAQETRRRFGWDIRILSGHEEAFLTASGVIGNLASPPAHALVFDIGGQSTEFIQTRGKEIVKAQSLSLGVVGLTEAFIRSDPPTPRELNSLATRAREILEEASWAAPPGCVLIGTAGTVTTIAAMLLGLKTYDPFAVNRALIRRDAIAKLALDLSGETRQRRTKRVGLHPLRADVIVAGLLLTLGIMDFYGFADLRVSDSNLLEGLWLWGAGMVDLSRASELALA
ncbi:MAG: hypothetical protein LBO66_01115 [Deltaproteobacteria bacterium]|jgi:exopolyphosphatase/guanosine-5'-triphosphate,3'-diphosphate pyrophosphatase|nr:hypothetical protein [Deltaproteobacteria bacterium]